MNLFKKNYIFQDIIKLKGVGSQLSKYLKKRKIEKIKDVVLNLPYSETDRSEIVSLDNLEVGKVQTIKVKIKKLNFPRIRNLPNKIVCENENGQIDIVYFNSREGYLRKLFPVPVRVFPVILTHFKHHWYTHGIHFVSFCSISLYIMVTSRLGRLSGKWLCFIRGLNHLTKTSFNQHFFCV